MTTFNTENCKKLIADLTYAKDTNFDLEGNWINSISNNSKTQLDELFNVVNNKYSRLSLAIALIKNQPIYLN